MENKNINVVFVCLGNICRSPAAEGIVKKMLADEGLDDRVSVDSAGTSSWNDGKEPDERMQLHGKKRGYNFDSIARQFRSSDFEKFDYIIVMDNNNYMNVKKLAITQEDVDKIHRMTDFSVDFADHDHVPDPYFGGDDGFNLVMDLLEDAAKGLIKDIKEKLQS